MGIIGRQSIGAMCSLAVLIFLGQVGYAGDTDAVRVKYASGYTTLVGLEPGVWVFSNRKYQIEEIPPELEGCMFTRRTGGRPTDVTLTIPTNATVYVFVDDKDGINGKDEGVAELNQYLADTGWATIPLSVAAGAAGSHRTCYKQQFIAAKQLTIVAAGFSGVEVAAKNLQLDLSGGDPGKAIATQPATQRAITTVAATMPATLPSTMPVATTRRAAATEPVVSRLPIPSPAALAPFNKQIDEVLKHDLADTTPAGRQRLGRKLMKLADQAQSSEEEFAILDRVRMAAASAGDATTAIRANDRITGKFAVDKVAYRTMIVTGLSKSVNAMLDCELTAQLDFSAVDDAIDAGDYGRASKLLSIVSPVVQKPQAVDLLRTFREKNKLVHDLNADANGLTAALLELKKHPDDPAANLIAGRFYCTAKHDWPKGLAYLAKCQDAKLKSLAELELIEPEFAADQGKRDLKLADQWWDFADKQSVVDRGTIKKHAEVLYTAAKPGLTGLAAMHVEQRLEAAPDARINLLPLLDLKRDIVQGSFTMANGVLYSAGNGDDKIEFKYEPPEEYDFIIEYSMFEGKYGVMQMLSKNQQPFIWEMGITDCTFQYMKNADIFNNKTTATLREPLEDGVRYKSTVQVRNNGVKAFIDGQFITEWKTDYSDLDPTKPWWLLRHHSYLGIGAYNRKAAIYSAEVVPFNRHTTDGEK